MGDIATTWNGTRGDYSLAGTGLRGGLDLSTAVLLSLFTDRRALPDDHLLDGSSDRRGWWGDAEGKPFGSRLWLLERAKRTQDTLRKARSFIEEAIQWLIDDDVVARFELTVEWPPGSTLQAQVVAVKNDGTREAMHFVWVWNQTGQTGDGAIPPGLTIARLDGTWTLNGAVSLTGLRTL